METKRLHFLDSVRGIAALCVVFNHFIYLFGIPPELVGMQRYLPVQILWDGGAAVGLFYVLSGYVLSRALVQRGGKTQLGSFYLSRVFRIFPAFVLTVLLSALGKHFLLSHSTDPAVLEPIKGFWASPSDLREVIRECLLFTSETSQLVIQGWTIRWEVLFSFLVPFLVFIVIRGKSWLLSFTAILLFYFAFPVFLFHFSLGVLLSVWSPFASFGPERKWARVSLLLVAVYLYSFRYTLPIQLGPILAKDITVYIKAIGAFGILSLILETPAWQRQLEKPFWNRIGRVSYSVYLTHYAILLCIAPYYMKAVTFVFGFSTSLERWVGALLTMGVTVVISIPLYNYVEVPGIRLGRKLGRLLEQKKTWDPTSVSTP